MSLVLIKHLGQFGNKLLPANRLFRITLVVVSSLVVVLGITLLAGWWYTWSRWHAAHEAIANERVPEAQAHFNWCLRVWPNNPEVQYQAARLARKLGDLGAADKHLIRCKELNGGPTERVQLEHLLVRVQAGEIDELASALFEAVQNGHPDSQEILRTLALAYIVRQRYMPASACLTLWIEKEPDNARTYYWRGWVVERLNNSKAAMQDYQKALELNPGFVEARVRVVEMLIEDKLVPDAIPHLDLLYQQAPDNPQVQARLGMCRFLEGRTGEARKLMEAAAVHLPKDAMLLVSLANLDLQEGRAADAERRLRQVLDDDSSDTEALFVLSSVLQVLGRPDEAAAALAEFEQKRKTVDRIHDLLKDADNATTPPAAHAEIGELFLTLGAKRTRFAVYWLERALERDPSNQRAHRALADHFDKVGKTDLAAEHRRQLIPTDEKPKK